MKLKILKSTIYGILGLIFTSGGIAGLVKPNLNVSNSDSLQHIPDSDVEMHQNLIHTTMELGAAIIPIGLLLIWCAIYYKGSRLNYFFLIFFMLFASIHWYEYLQGNRDLLSPLINSIPLVLVVLLFLIHRKVGSKSDHSQPSN